MKFQLWCLLSGAFFANSTMAALTLTSGTYTQNFNSIGTSLPSSWDVRTSATAESLGTVGSFTTTATSWGDSGGAFKNLSSADIASTSSVTNQGNNTNRALGIRQTAGFGDPGAAFNFNFSTVNLTVQTITIDLLMLSVQDRSTTWSIQYGLGASPSAFTTLDTWSDSGAFGTTNFSFDATDFGTLLNDQTEVWFRVVALSASSGSSSRDTMAIDNFTITAVPEPAAAVFGSIGMLFLLRRRR